VCHGDTSKVKLSDASHEIRKEWNFPSKKETVVVMEEVGVGIWNTVK
jgi:hypothetical protein